MELGYRVLKVKSVIDGSNVEDWYFNSCVLQCAVYKSLLDKSNKHLITSKFFADMGNPVIETTINNDIKYYLRFGNSLYLVEVTNTDFIVDFIVKKAVASLEWDSAKNFDAKYKHKEFETLKDYFTVSKV